MLDDLLVDFIKTGKLGFLRLGLSLAEVKSRIPSLGETLFNKTNASKTFDLGGLSLFFWRDVLISIAINFQTNPLNLPPEVCGSKILQKWPKNLDQFTKELLSLGIDYNEVFNEDGFIQIHTGQVFVKFIDNKTDSLKVFVN